ncbi:DUF5320 domain-containing protein [Candidatus Latescibacterota bacterium]
MPRGDRTGPNGMGPMTGRAAGFCAGYGVPGYINPAGGRGYWKRGFRSGGWGHRNWYYVTGLNGWQRAGMGNTTWDYYPSGPPAPYPLSEDQEIEILKTQASNLENTLDDIRKRIEELKHHAQKVTKKNKKE